MSAHEMEKYLGRTVKLDFQNTDRVPQGRTRYLPANGPRNILAEVASTFLTAL